MGLVAAALGGTAGTSAKQGIGRLLGEKGPETTRQALTEDAEGGVEQSEYEMGGKVLGAFMNRYAQSSVNAARRGRVANFVAMAGPSGETGSKFNAVLDDMDRVQATRPPVRAGKDVHNLVNATSKALDKDFNTALASVGRNQTVPMRVSNNILSLITPDMPMTGAGRADMKAIRQAAVDYQRPWTYSQLNASRRADNDFLTAYYNKDSQAQSASSIEAKIRKVARDGKADLVYDAVDQANPGFGAKALKQKQGHLWDLSDQLDTRLKKLADQQLEKEGKTVMQTVRPSAYASTHGVHGYLSGVSDLLPGGGPEKYATTQARRAFPARFGQTASSVISPMQLYKALAPARQRLLLATPFPNLLRMMGATSGAVDKMNEGNDAQ